MAYKTTQKQARFKVQDNPPGTIIESWKRTVEKDADGNPTGVVDFEAMASKDPKAGTCQLTWTIEIGEDGSLTLVYDCEDIDCSQGHPSTHCVLQFSYDQQAWYDVTEGNPPSGEEAFFRCVCRTEH